MTGNTKDLENTILTDEQTAEVAGGFPVVSKPFPRNAKLEDEQTEQVSGGKLLHPLWITKQNNNLTNDAEASGEHLGMGNLRAKDGV